jgi:hypothetical protein
MNLKEFFDGDVEMLKFDIGSIESGGKPIILMSGNIPINQIVSNSYRISVQKEEEDEPNEYIATIAAISFSRTVPVRVYRGTVMESKVTSGLEFLFGRTSDAKYVAGLFNF